MYSIKVYSLNDGWSIEVYEETGDLRWEWTWGHEEYEYGSGGERLFADILKALEYKVSFEETY